MRTSESRVAHALHGVRNGLTIGVVAGVALGTAALAGLEVPRTTSDQPSYAQRLADLHGCWFGHAPTDMTDRLPGGTVLKPANSSAPVYRHTSQAVSVALAHVYGGRYRQVVVYAFCR